MSADRVFRLGEITEAAAARVLDQLNANTSTSKVSFEPVLDAKIKPLSVRRDDLFNPTVPLVSCHVRSNLRFAKVGGLLMILALTASVVASQPIVTDIWPHLVTDSIRVVQAWSSTALEAISIGPAKPRLIVEQSRAARGEPAPLGLTLDGPPVAGAVVHIAGLAHGMELSAGRAVGDGWEVPANDVGYAWIAPPEGFAGSVDLVAELRGPDGEVADRRTITLEWASAIVAVPVVRQLTESTTLASISPNPVQLQGDQNYRTDVTLSESETTPQSLEPRWKETSAASSTLLEPIQLRSDRTEMMPAELSKSPSQRQPNSEEVAVLLKRGKDLIATGDLAAARLVLRRAVEANDAEAALALGATYDPLVLRQLKVYGFTPDAAMARSWYEKAAELGSAAAPRRLEMLTERMGTR
jgi:hypothetical protein